MLEKTINVLLVEDDEESAELVVTAAKMGKIDFAFNFATNGLEALDYLHQRNQFKNAARPDLILLDLNLPIVSGPEVLDDLKSDPALRKIPIVLLSTTNIHDKIQSKYNLSKYCCHTKPDHFKDYIDLLSRLQTAYQNGDLNPN